MILEINKFLKNLSSSGRIIGIDFGIKNIGLALSDTSQTIASAYDTWDNQTFWRKFPVLVGTEEVVGIIIGNPKFMSGQDSEITLLAQKFAQKIEAAYPELPIAMWDERLSSSAVERMLIEKVDMSRAKRKDVIDKLAASYILQGALDFLKNKV
jgi:putative Holliday junction resolvase